MQTMTFFWAMTQVTQLELNDSLAYLAQAESLAKPELKSHMSRLIAGAK